jgi:hypothetical protein
MPDVLQPPWLLIKVLLIAAPLVESPTRHEAAGPDVVSKPPGSQLL